ncbi:hypothetical protein LCGC14_1401200 [marine sediment metagenome]|uniref:Uncharacterized protein n=1 Tax=marine sediment metagenome TaxID=412755 RepID=A0A0F9MYL3_9ZZZZ
MKKSKEFIIKRGSQEYVQLRYIRGICITTFCHRAFTKFFGISLKVGEQKRIKITIEEIKK